MLKEDYLLFMKGQYLCEKSQPELLLDNNSVVYMLPAKSPDNNDILTINLQKGRTLLRVMNFMASDKVSKIATAVTELFGVPLEHQTLMYCGIPLPNKTLLECRMVNNCRIKLVISPDYKK
jgi:hypothetical protein